MIRIKKFPKMECCCRYDKYPGVKRFNQHRLRFLLKQKLRAEAA